MAADTDMTSAEQAGDDITVLCEALLLLKTADEARRFLRDLATPGELQALAERWRVARLLNEGEKSYREISAETGVSTTTVTRVARFLTQEEHQGYRLVLDRTESKR
jgi:TrpR-related protein YerC/YecD